MGLEFPGVPGFLADFDSSDQRKLVDLGWAINRTRVSCLILHSQERWTADLWHSYDIRDQGSSCMSAAFIIPGSKPKQQVMGDYVLRQSATTHAVNLACFGCQAISVTCCP